MPSMWTRIRAPLVFVSIAVLATIAMVADRGADAPRDALPWWQSVVLEAAAPLQKLVAAPAGAIADTWSDYVNLVGVGQENEALRDRIAALEDENLQFREALVTSGQLERIASMATDFDTPMLPSQVVGLDVSPLFRSALVDRGADHGVQAGNPVITNEGVVGMVTAASDHAARTMLVMDRQSTVDGIVQRSRTRGLVRGQGRDDLHFESVVRGADVQIGDVIITSGLGGIYPKGLRLGEVVGLTDPGGSLMQQATVQPAVDFGRLEQVFVMLRRGRPMDLLYGDFVPPPLPPTVSSSALAPGEAESEAAPPCRWGLDLGANDAVPEPPS
jgi:rod shape-determining protein MreC